MEGIKALLFDIDGTVLDTREFIYQATEHALQAGGHLVPERTIISKVVGRPFPEYYHLLVGIDADTDKLIEAHRSFQLNNFHLSLPFPNSVEVLKKLREKKYKLAAVTTRHRHTSHPTLIQAGIFDFFDAIITTDMVDKHKPDPTPLFKALELLGEKPENAAMIGDSYIDILAGKNAGTKTVRATYGFHKERMHEPEPDYFIDDISELLKIL